MSRKGGKYKDGELVDSLTKPANPKANAAAAKPPATASDRPEKARNKEVKNG